MIHKPPYAAHTPSKKNRQWHSLVAHTLGVTERAVDFATALDNTGVASAWARYLGLLHDLGKFTPAFQKYLWQCYVADVQKTSSPPRGSAPHKQMGAVAALMDMKGMTDLFSLPIYGHHGGMLGPTETRNKSFAKTDEAEVMELRKVAAEVDPRLVALVPDLNALAAMPYASDPRRMEMFLRLLFSCLTDADCLDTEAHTNPADARRRLDTPPPSIITLRDTLRARQAADFAHAASTPVNSVRREVYDACRRSAVDFPPGVFDLTVPTGGGKTRSSLAFALEHAACYGLHRVIYAIPYTSIVDQTAQVFRNLFGPDPGTVLEHHSAIEPKPPHAEGETADGDDEEELWRRLAAQNWDAPLVVTTTVQLFESLFSNRPAACRKLHRLARSVIVLDEVQTLPPHLLEPLMDGLRSLATDFGATIVLCTATQPALKHGVSDFLTGFDKVQPIIADPARHFAALRRVRYHVAPKEWTWEQVAEQMRDAGSCLCIVNTRRQARALMDLVDPERNARNVFHLSTLMCGKHRRRVLRQVRLCLRWRIPVLLVSTSLIECGVDLDFPRVLRAIGPLDRLIQAGGRCNREGKHPREESHVVVFTPADGATPGGLYQMALNRTVNLIKRMEATGEEMNFDDPAGVTDFFARFYSDLQAEVDAKKVQQRREQYDYREVAGLVKLIEDDTLSVLIQQYDPEKAEAIQNQAEAVGGMTRNLWQQVQPLCVSLPRRDVEACRLGVDPLPGGLYVWSGDYDRKTGVPLPEDMADGPVYRPEQLVV